MADVFSYVPKPGTLHGLTIDPASGQAVDWCVDFVKQQASGALQLGVIERINGTQGVWFENTPVYSLFTEESVQIGDDSYITNGLVSEVGEVKWTATGTALAIINDQRDKMVVDWIGEINGKLDRRFRPAGAATPTGGANMGPPFVDEHTAVAWLAGRCVVLLKVVNDRVVHA